MKKPITSEDLLKYKFLSDVKLCPDGTKACFIVKNSSQEDNCYQSRLWLWNKTDDKLTQLTDIGSESSYIWEDDTHILFPAVRSSKEKKMVEAGETFTSFYRLDLTGGEAQQAFTVFLSVEKIIPLEEDKFALLALFDRQIPDYCMMTDEAREKTIEDRKADKDYTVIDESPFWGNGIGVTNGKRAGLFIYDFADDELQRITSADMNVDSLEVIGDEIVFSGEEYISKPNQNHSHIYTYNWQNDDEVKLIWHSDCFTVYTIKNVDGKIIVVGSDCKQYGLNQNPWLYRLNKDSGSMEMIMENHFSMNNSVGSDCRLGSGEGFQAVGDKLCYVATREDRANINIISFENGITSGQQLTNIEGSVDSYAVFHDKKSAVFAGLVGQKLQELYTIDFEKGNIRKITHFNEDALSGKYVAIPQGVSVVSQGLDVNGWVLLPINYDENKTYPAILDIHGGPKTVYGTVFYHEMQMWAGKGYFVFFCNPKGGDGRDDEFADIRGEYGSTDYKNIMDFTSAVLEKYPQIDRKRICVTGGSYGGFMTNWIIGHTDMFCAAASQRSIANWISMYGISDIGAPFVTDQNDGDVFEEPEKMWEHSPMKYAKNIVTPTLFIHSDEDYRCPVAEGYQMFTSLCQNNVPARMCVFHGENHELSRSGKPLHRLRRLREITEWFDKYTAEK